MAELFEAVASWESLLLVLLVFGIAPGVVLRLFVLCYPKDDPRRRELTAELYVVPRLQRPLWVAEQMETAVFEGFSLRRAARRTRPRRTATVYVLAMAFPVAFGLWAVVAFGLLPMWLAIAVAALLAVLIGWLSVPLLDAERLRQETQALALGLERVTVELEQFSRDLSAVVADAGDDDRPQ